MYIWLHLQTILTKHFSAVEEHSTRILQQLLHGITSDPSHYSHDIDVTSQLWVEDSLQVARDKEKTEVSTLSLKTKACTPSIYRQVCLIITGTPLISMIMSRSSCCAIENILGLFC